MLVEQRIVQPTMAVVRHPVVVTGPRLAVVAHVPLTQMRGFVAELLQFEVVIRNAMTRRVARDVVDNAVAAGVLPGKYRRAVGRANRRGVKRTVEHHALVRDAVDVRRFHIRVAACAEFVVAQIVDEDNQEIGFHRHSIYVDYVESAYITLA